MRKYNIYKNKIKLINLIRLIIICNIVLLLGLKFVWIKNQQIVLGQKLGEIERSINRADVYIENWEIKISKIKNNKKLIKQLDSKGIKLKEINQDKIINL